MALPSLFVSHGSPTLLIDDCPAHDFLSTLGARLPGVEAILVISAHHDAAFERGMSITGSAQPPTNHDFGGFPDSLYRMCYPALGAPALAAAVAQRLNEAGTPVRVDGERGLDHGAWVPLKLIWPAADIPVVQLSIDSRRDAAWHYALGRALAPLRHQGVLVLGSGSMTHNLSLFFRTRPALDTAPPAWVSDFAEWVAAHMAAGDAARLIGMTDYAPHYRNNHPTPDHILPLFVAMGAGTEAGAEGALHAERLHASTTYGLLAMDAYAFALEDRLP